MSHASVLLELMNRRAEQVEGPNTLDPEEIIEEAISKADLLVPDFLESLREGAAKRVVPRQDWADAVRREIEKDCVEPLKASTSFWLPAKKCTNAFF